jgi:hypothetical protein
METHRHLAPICDCLSDNHPGLIRYFWAAFSSQRRELKALANCKLIIIAVKIAHRRSR